MSDALVFECLACGTDLTFQPGQLSVRCGICEDDRPLPLRFSSDVGQSPLDGALEVGLPQGRSLWHCPMPGCGVAVSSASPVDTCPCCASRLAEQAELPGLLRIHAVLPFLCDENDARFRLRSELVRLKLPGGAQRLERAYLPWIVLSCEAQADYSGRKGVEHSDEHRTWIEWYDVSGRVERPFENMRACGSPAPPAAMCVQLEPWDWAFAQPIADSPPTDAPVVHSTWPREQLFTRIVPDLDGQLYDEILYDIGGDHQEVHNSHTTRHSEHYRVVLLPVWIGALEHRHTFMMINGRTGEVAIAGHASNDPYDEDEDDGFDPSWWRRPERVGMVIGIGLVFVWIVWAFVLG